MMRTRTFGQRSAARQTIATHSAVTGRGYFPDDSKLSPILYLQRTIGNRAVQRMLRREFGSGGAGGADTVQAKPAGTEPAADFSPEADIVAEQQDTQVAAPRAIHEVLHDSGQPLAPGLRAFMEPRFGQDFSTVRVHADREAEEWAAGLGARAFTLGDHISFGANEYAPETRPGRSLIAHELAHVTQNRFATVGAAAVEPVSSHAEAEANRAGHLAGIGLPAGPLTARHAGVALTATSDRVVPLISYSAGDWAVTED